MRFLMSGIQALTISIILTNILILILPSAAAAAAAGIKKTTLYATHYNGHIYTLTLTHPSSPGPGTYTLSQTQSLRTCGDLPSWLTLFPPLSSPEGKPDANPKGNTNAKEKEKGERTLYCTDESGSPTQNGSLTALSVSAEDGRLSEVVKVATPGGGVYSTVYETSSTGGEGGRWLAIAH